MKYMSAVEEDILTNQNYIEKGIVFDKLLESMIVSPINLDDLIFGDKDALLIATKILGYGKNYTFKVYENGGMVDKTIDLTLLEDKHFNEKDLITPRVNEFSFALSTKFLITDDSLFPSTDKIQYFNLVANLGSGLFGNNFFSDFNSCSMFFSSPCVNI